MHVLAPAPCFLTRCPSRCEVSHKLIGADTQEHLVRFKPNAYYCDEHSPHPGCISWCLGSRKKHNMIRNKPCQVVCLATKPLLKSYGPYMYGRVILWETTVAHCKYIENENTKAVAPKYYLLLTRLKVFRWNMNKKKLPTKTSWHSALLEYNALFLVCWCTFIPSMKKS
jgi:hypothetical protein